MCCCLALCVERRALSVPDGTLTGRTLTFHCSSDPRQHAGTSLGSEWRRGERERHDIKGEKRQSNMFDFSYHFNDIDDHIRAALPTLIPVDQ